MSFELENYQSLFIDDIGVKAKKHKTICAQLGTGGGKTVVFANIAYRYIFKSKQDVCIFCDSQDILDQTRRTFLEWFGVDTDVIDSNSSSIKRANLFGNQPRIFVAMVETFDRRSSKSTFLSQLSNVGLVIIDECHMGNFIKIFDHFPFSLRIGFTATPLSADRKKPLNKYYETIVCGPSIRKLIEHNQTNPSRGLVEDITYCLTDNINRKEIEEEQLELGYNGQDFDQDLTASKLSGKRQIQNTIDKYIKHAAGMKTICFNSNVSHSKLVTSEMVKAGLNARHMDASCSKEYKADCKKWLKETNNAILCNVGMTTKGFDEKSIECIILNRLTKSLPLFGQMCGRGGRAYQYPNGEFKKNFVCIDLCDNVLGGGHGRWSDPIDWEDKFYNPFKPKGTGVAPVKICPECDYVNHSSARVCKGKIEDYFSNDGSEMDCGFEFEIKGAVEDTVERQMILVSNNIDVEAIINYPKFQNRHEYFTFFETIKTCAFYIKKTKTYDFIDKDEFEVIWDMTYRKIVEWQTIKGRSSSTGRKKRNTQWFTDKGRETLIQELRNFNFTVYIENKEENVES